MADTAGFGHKGLAGGKIVKVTIDPAKMAETFAGKGITEEDISQNLLAIEAIWATEGKGRAWKERQTEYILGTKARPKPAKAKLTKEEKAAKRRADQLAAKERLGGFGIGVTTVTRQERSEDERDEARKLAARARGRLRRRNQQVGPALLPDFYTKYFDVDVDRRGKKMTDEVKELINEARESGLWTEMRAAIASESLLKLDIADMNKVISDVKKRRNR